MKINRRKGFGSKVPSQEKIIVTLESLADDAIKAAGDCPKPDNFHVILLTYDNEGGFQIRGSDGQGVNGIVGVLQRAAITMHLMKTNAKSE